MNMLRRWLLTFMARSFVSSLSRSIFFGSPIWRAFVMFWLSSKAVEERTAYSISFLGSLRSMDAVFVPLSM